jgi:hypothetical protein
VPITSVRTGSVPGTHEIIFDAPFEQIRLVHEARDGGGSRFVLELPAADFASLAETPAASL